MYNDITAPATEELHGVKIRLASSDTILGWSHGEVTKPETINYRTQRPEKDGLFDERIFGPVKDWECYCGKYKRIRYKGIVCDKCGVEVTKSSVRRERMGHIKLAVPVAHVWYIRSVPSRIAMTLDLGAQEVERVVYFAAYIITNVDDAARTNIVEQIEAEFKSKKKEIESQYEQTIAKTRGDFAKQTGDQDVLTAKMDAEVNRLQDACAHEIAALETIRDAARTELKSLRKYQVLSELAYRDLSLKYGQVFTAGIGAEALQKLLNNLDLEQLAADLEGELKNQEGQSAKKTLRRLKLIRAFIKSGSRPSWMLLEHLPVIPPDLRPMVQLDGGRFASSDLNDLYRRVINRNNRLKKLLDIRAPEVITRNEKRMLQEAVDALIDNSIRHGKEVTASTGQKRKLRSLSDMLKGKAGRFRQNLLGKRVDYSGRSVIVVGPNLKLHQCGIPKAMALELFKPFVISKLIAREYAHNVRSASRLIEQARTEVFDILEEVTQGHYVLLNRAPTLHRLGFQAFQPVLIEGKAIQLHPLVCAAFNADFDGDQMAVHVPLTEAAQREAKEIMSSSRNLLKPASGEPVMVPDKDMVAGCFYITVVRPDAKGAGKIFSDTTEAILAYNNKVVEIQAPIKVRMDGEIIETSVGRLIFNKIIPAGLGYRNEQFDKKRLQAIVREVYREHGTLAAAEFLDEIKRTGFTYMKQSGLSWGMADLTVPDTKPGIMASADDAVQATYEQFDEGLLTEAERSSRVIEIWTDASEQIAKQVVGTIKDFGSVHYIVSSGARGSVSQITQMAGLKGLVTNPAGDVIELPCRGSFKEGLGVLEYFISTHGSRKGMSDTALRTADAGYLTRRLVDVAQDMVVNAEDCGTHDYDVVTVADSVAMNQTLEKRLFGRVLAVDTKGPDGQLIGVRNAGIDEQLAKALVDAGLTEVKCRSVLKCRLTRGICRMCYGYDLGFNRMVELGAAAGIVAAQAIGEPGTQLTMRTFHSGGAASAGKDITQGLPRVEELFEAREPKGLATVSEISGTAHVSVNDMREYVVRIEGEGAVRETLALPVGGTAVVKDGARIEIGDILATHADGSPMKSTAVGLAQVNQSGLTIVHDGDSVREYIIPAGYTLLVKDGELVYAGQALTEGNLNPAQIIALQGTESAQKYIVREVQAIYVSQGQQIHDKHIEVVVRQMFSRMQITEPGDSSLIAGDIVDHAWLHELNDSLIADNKTPAKAQQLIMGITKISLSTDSFLAAASFQETTRVLIEAAVNGKTDYLRGLKENVIIGKLIPAGTGFNPQAAQAAIDASSFVETDLA